MLEALGITQEEYEALEDQLGQAGTDLYSGGELQLDTIGDLGEIELEGLEDVDLDGLMDEFGDIFDELSGLDGESYGSKSGSASGKNSVKQTV